MSWSQHEEPTITKYYPVDGNPLNIIPQENSPMRRFVIIRSVDITGISGTGIILYGVEWLPGGPCDVYWLGTKTTGQYPSIDMVKSTHCYNDNARIEWLD